MDIITQWPAKYASEVKDYAIDWSRRLGTDTIAASSWSIPVEITQDSSTFTDTVATVWLSGGTAGKYLLTNEITTAGGRTLKVALYLDVEA